jgi:hypothetical protein
MPDDRDSARDEESPGPSDREPGGEQPGSPSSTGETAKVGDRPGVAGVPTEREKEQERRTGVGGDVEGPTDEMYREIPGDRVGE